MARERFRSLDVLRGATIFAMTLCAAIGWHSDLPAWMFHCQVPPPDYAFHPEVRGITWVDMVFPFFLFTMGAVLPFSLGRKRERGVPEGSILQGLAKRWLVLAGFSLVLGHAELVDGLGLGGWAEAGVDLALWGCLFLALVRGCRKWLSWLGWGGCALILLALHRWGGMDLDFRHKDIIIWLLAHASLLAGLVWLLTAGKPRIRALVWLLVVAMKLLGWSFPQYLIVVLTGTFVGDWLQRPFPGNPERTGLRALLALLAVGVQLWGLYTRHVTADGLITLALAAGFLWADPRDRSTLSRIGMLGFALLLAGIAFDPVDGGIAKDDCNLSYLLVTGGQACLALYGLLAAELRMPLSRNLEMTGQNPMVAYTACWFVVYPLLQACGVMDWYGRLAAGNPALGILQGVVLTLATMALTCLCTRWKLFWKS